MSNTAKTKLLFIILVFLPALPVFSQAAPEKPAEKQELFWLCPGMETALFSDSGLAIGGGISLGYGKRAAIGLKAAFFCDFAGEVKTVEINLLARWYFISPFSGPFAQLSVGPAFFFDSEDDDSTLGIVSASLCAGWRFLIEQNWFLEASIRGGYPFIAGVGFSFGYRF